MQLDEIISQLNLSATDSDLVTVQALTNLVWKSNFTTKLGQLTATAVNTTHKGTFVIAKTRTDDPDNITRMSPEFGDAGVYNGRFFVGVPGSETLRYQCTGVVQAGTTNGAPVSAWRKGTQAISGLPKYTVVATFHGNGGTRYDNPPTYRQHVGIYVGADSQGIYLLSQNMDGTGQNPVGGLDLRRFPFSSSDLIAGANNYYRVMR